MMTDFIEMVGLLYCVIDCEELEYILKDIQNTIVLRMRGVWLGGDKRG